MPIKYPVFNNCARKVVHLNNVQLQFIKQRKIKKV